MILSLQFSQPCWPLQLGRVSTSQEDLVEVLVGDLVDHLQEGLEEVLVDMKEVLQMQLEVPWKKPSLVFLAMTTPYLLRFLKLHSCVMAK